MNRLKKELKKRGIIFEANEMQVLKGAEYDTQSILLFFTKDFIVCRFDCAVLDSEFHIFDKNFNLIATQQIYKTNISFLGAKANPWFTCTNFENDKQEENSMNENEMKQETTATENSMKQEEIVMNENEMKQEEKRNNCDLYSISEMIEKLEEMIEKLEEKQEEINSEAEEILEDDEIFCNTCEELDNYNGFLCDERLYYMQDINELYYGLKPLDLLEKVNDDFSTNDDYFWEDYEGLHSTDNREDFYREYHTNEEVWEEILNNTSCSFDSEIEEKIEQYEAITNMINCLQEKKKSLQEFVGDYEEMIEDYESLL